MKNLALECHQVSHTIGRDQLFRDLSFTIERGEFVIVIGPNGSGKTTLMKIVLGLIAPTTGAVDVYDSDIAYVPQYLKRDQFLPMTVKELFLTKVKRASFWLPSPDIIERITEYLSRTGVESLIDMQIRHLSGGQYQRVMIAFALANDPGMIILDEPVSAVDIEGENAFFSMIQSIQKETGITVIMVSHDLDIVYRYATQVICLNKTLVCQGVPSKVLNKKTIQQTFSDSHGVYHHTHGEDGHKAH